MASFYQDNSLSIGRTPIVKLIRIPNGAKATILAKIEGCNPSYFVKCRIGAAMVWDAGKRGLLKPGKEIIESTSEDTGIAQAFVAAARGHTLTLTVPQTTPQASAAALHSHGKNQEILDAHDSGAVDYCTPPFDCIHIKGLRQATHQTACCCFFPRTAIPFVRSAAVAVLPGVCS